MPAIERPPARTDIVDPAEPQESLADLVARRRAHGDRMVAEAMEREREAIEAQSRERAALKTRQQGNGQDDRSDCP